MGLLEEILRGGMMGATTDLVGTPVDVVSGLLAPFGYRHEKPVMGSAWIADKLGVKPSGTLPESVARFATGLLSPGPDGPAVLGLLMAAGHAKKGGQVGKNSEFYKGGQFLPSSEFTEKGKMQFPKHMRAGTKDTIDIFGRAVERPVDGLFPVIKGQDWDIQHFRATGELKPFIRRGTGDMPGMTPDDIAKAERYAQAYNRGARWHKDGVFYDASGNPL